MIIAAAVLKSADHELRGVWMAGIWGLTAFAGVGLVVAGREPRLQRDERMRGANNGDPDLGLTELCEELQRPFFRRYELLVLVSLAIVPITAAGVCRSVWPLLGLAFPSIWIAATAIATLAKRYFALKQAFSLQSLEPGDRTGHPGANTPSA